MASNSGRKDVNIKSLISGYPTWAHPAVHYNQIDWSILRDTYQGERQVKDGGVGYLPHPSGMDDNEYQLYLENATYYNMVNRTINALVGTIFRRNPVITGLPANLTKKVRRITKDKQSLRSFTRTSAKEIIHMGRYGVLVDRTPDGKGDPYFTSYIAEAILDWTTEMIGDRQELTEVILMEAFLPERTSSNEQRTYRTRIRALRLVNGRYQQHVYDADINQGYPDIAREPDQVLTPTNRGVALDFIPFMLFSTASNTADIERSAMLDIANMNISHYRSYAHLEHGRFYTGLPVYYVSKQNTESQGEYTIGPSTVWEVGPGEKAGLLEFNGQGLKFLENAISTKETHISTLGGRLIGINSSASSESDNQTSMRDRNEQALLLNVSISMDEGFSRLLAWWAMWQDVRSTVAEEIEIEFNKDFLLKEASAREFRAVQQMYEAGILPVEVIFDYMRKAEVIPDWMQIEEFTTLIKKTSSFINNPDIDAKQRGFPDKKTELQLEQQELDREAEKDIADLAAANALKLARENKPKPTDPPTVKPGSTPVPKPTK